MKTLVLLWVLISVMMTTRIQAKELQALFCNATFYSQVQGPYVETYLMVFGPSADYIKTSRGTCQASLKVTILFKNGDKIIDFRKYNLFSAELEDTLKGLPNFIDQQRIPLPYGVYQLDLVQYVGDYFPSSVNVGLHLLGFNRHYFSSENFFSHIIFPFSSYITQRPAFCPFL